MLSVWVHLLGCPDSVDFPRGVSPRMSQTGFFCLLLWSETGLRKALKEVEFTWRRIPEREWRHVPFLFSGCFAGLGSPPPSCTFYGTGESDSPFWITYKSLEMRRQKSPPCLISPHKEQVVVADPNVLLCSGCHLRGASITPFPAGRERATPVAVWPWEVGPGVESRLWYLFTVYTSTRPSWFL